MHLVRMLLPWVGLTLAAGVPIFFAATSDYLAWRDPIYIAGGFAGVVSLALLLMQPLLIGGFLPGLGPPRARRLHRVVGGLLAAAVVVHVAGLWITSPPDIEDALLLRAPTPFSVWGVAAMWALFAAALLAALRRRLSPRTWRGVHKTLAGVVVLGGVIHAMLIEGTMETVTKAVLSGLVVLATAVVLIAPRLRSRLIAAGRQ